MEHHLITSASGWRKVFAVSGKEEDPTPDIGMQNTTIAILAAEAFADYILSGTTETSPTILVGIDSRPTGPALADAVIRTLMAKKITVMYTGITAAPEIMAFCRSFDGFIYISASHNPIGHNGIKFGLNDGGVLNGTENAKIVKLFETHCAAPDAEKHAAQLQSLCPLVDLDWVYAESVAVKKESASSYHSFAKTVISGTDNMHRQNKLFAEIRESCIKNPIGVICDMNGSARTLSIDSTLLKECGINFYTINDTPGKIAHAIIPEPENLVWCAREMERLQKEGHHEVVLGYMPDCDGDRGNIVFWNQKEKKAQVLKAQEVFSLSVLSELAGTLYECTAKAKHGLQQRCEQILEKEQTDSFEQNKEFPANFKNGVAVNGPTSMRIEEIAHAFNTTVFRAEVGEANVVGLAREKRAEGYNVRILGEGSNGGTITHPSAVRDPLNTLFACIKLLVLHDTTAEDGSFKKGLFHLWCTASGQDSLYTQASTLENIIETLPVYTTTGVSENRAVLHIKTTDHGLLKKRFQKIFETEWKKHSADLYSKYGFVSYEAICTNGTKEKHSVNDFSSSGKGGLKIVFYGPSKADLKPLAFIWMRGSGTEPVFRVLCDVKGRKPDEEKWLLEWETQMLLEADTE